MQELLSHVRSIRHDLFADGHVGAVVYDSRSLLSRALTDLWREHLDTTTHFIDFDTIEDTATFASELKGFSAGSAVILIQSSSFRLSNFRIRLELFQLGIHCIEYTHLERMQESEIETYLKSLEDRSAQYESLIDRLDVYLAHDPSIEVVSTDGSRLTWPLVETPLRRNTGKPLPNGTRWGMWPVGECFTEAVDLKNFSGSCIVDTYPDDIFSIIVTEPFPLTIKEGQIVDTHSLWPQGFTELYEKVLRTEGSVMIRELGIGMNPHISTEKKLTSVGAHERKLGVHLSMGAKHGVYGKKLPDEQIQHMHIDLFVTLQEVIVGKKSVLSLQPSGHLEWTLES